MFFSILSKAGLAPASTIPTRISKELPPPFLARLQQTFIHSLDQGTEHLQRLIETPQGLSGSGIKHREEPRRRGAKRNQPIHKGLTGRCTDHPVRRTRKSPWPRVSHEGSSWLQPSALLCGCEQRALPSFSCNPPCQAAAPQTERDERRPGPILHQGPRGLYRVRTTLP